MRRRNVVLVLIIASLLLTSSLLLTNVLWPLTADSNQAQPNQESIFGAYSAIAAAQRDGGNVSGLVDQLNALINSSQATGNDYPNSTVLQRQSPTSIVVRAQQLGSENSILEEKMNILGALAVSLTLVICVAGYCVLPDVFWSLW